MKREVQGEKQTGEAQGGQAGGRCGGRQRKGSPSYRAVGGAL